MDVDYINQINQYGEHIEIGDFVYVHDQFTIKGPVKIIGKDPCTGSLITPERFCFVFEDESHKDISYCFKTLELAQKDIKDWEEFRQRIRSKHESKTNKT